jgi:P27 family predicted phage terminase small subunit
VPNHLKPTAIKRIEGNPGRRRLNSREPQPIGLPSKPDFITGEAAREWDRAIGAMLPGVYTAADGPQLAVYCVAWIMFRNALALVAREGTRSVGSLGQVVPHPALGIAAKQSEIILRVSDRLGMNPAARVRLETFGKTGKFAGLFGGDGPWAA